MSTKLTPSELAEIRERAEKATAGPWESDNQKDEHGASYYQAVVSDGKVLFDTYNSTAAVIHEDVDEDGYYKWDEVGRCNIAFAVNARTDTPALLAHISALEEELKAAQEVIDGAMADVRSCGEISCDECDLRPEALRAELKAAQDIKLAGQEYLNQTLAQLRTGFVNDFRAQLIGAAKEAGFFKWMLEFILNFEASEVSE